MSSADCAAAVWTSAVCRATSTAALVKVLMSTPPGHTNRNDYCRKGTLKGGDSMNSDISSHARPRLTAGPVTAPAGTKASGEIAVPAAQDEATTIPITIVNGAKEGPLLALVAGNHGYE